MHTDVANYEYLIYLATLTSEASVLALIVIRKHTRELAGVCAVLACHLAICLPLLLTVKYCSAVAYRHVYLACTLLDYAVQFYLVYTLAQSGRLKRKTHHVAAWLAAFAILAIIAHADFSHAPAWLNSEWAFTLEMDRYLSFSRCVVLGVIALQSAISLSPWSPRTLRVYIGFCLYGLTQLVFLQTQIGQGLAGFDIAKQIPTLSYFATLTLWASAALYSQPALSPVLGAEDLANLKTTLNRAVGQLNICTSAAKE